MITMQFSKKVSMFENNEWKESKKEDGLKMENRVKNVFSSHSRRNQYLPFQYFLHCSFLIIDLDSKSSFCHSTFLFPYVAVAAPRFQNFTLPIFHFDFTYIYVDNAILFNYSWTWRVKSCAFVRFRPSHFIGCYSTMTIVCNNNICESVILSTLCMNVHGDNAEIKLIFSIFRFKYVQSSKYSNSRWLIWPVLQELINIRSSQTFF